MPNAVDDAHGDALTIDDYLIERPSQTVLIRVKGDSMMDAGILEGDLVVVEKTATAKRGDIVVAIVDGQFTLKRLDIDRGAVRAEAREQGLSGDPCRRRARDLRRDGRPRAQAVDRASRQRPRRAGSASDSRPRPRPGNRRTSLRAPRSVSAWLVTLFAFVPSGESFFHQIDGATTTPGRVRSVTRAVAVNAPRSLKIRTRSPVAMLREIASSGWMSRCGVFSSATKLGRFANDELRKLRARRRDERERIPSRQRRDCSPPIRAAGRRSAADRARRAPALAETELALAGRRREIAFRKRRVRVRHREPLEARRLQRLPIEARRARVVRDERLRARGRRRCR